MERFFNFIRKYKIAIGAITLLLIVIIFASGLRKASQVQVQQRTPAPTIAPVEAQGEWGRVSEFIPKLGEPIRGTESSNKQGVFEYRSNSVNDRNEVVYVDNVPVFYKEIITEAEGKTSQSIKQKFGDAEIVLYGELSELGYNLYAYPSKGIAYLGAEKSGVLFEIWYFAPTDSSTFKELWAKDYSVTLEDGKF